jgi:DNA-directed RNA polymerase subunit RPC12/RpoP
MTCSRCLRKFTEDDDLDVTIDAEGIVTCAECIAEERAHHEAEWRKNRDPWAEEAHEKDCRCDECSDRRIDAAECKWEQEQGK